MAFNKNKSIAIVKREIRLTIPVGTVIKYDKSEMDMAYFLDINPYDRDKPSQVGLYMKTDEDFFQEHMRLFYDKQER